MLNDFHSGAFGGHLFGLATTQKILHVGYFWPLIFKYCVEAVKNAILVSFTLEECTLIQLYSFMLLPLVCSQSGELI